MDLDRRDLLTLGGLTVAGAMLGPSTLRAQTAKRGGTLSLRLWDPPHFDPYLNVTYKTQVVYSFTHSRLLKHKVGPSVPPGTFPLEGDLAESWTQPGDTTYVFKLRKGVRWHAKPPLNGRELTADDVVYSIERFRTIKGNANASMLDAVEKVEAPDRYTVRFTLKEPYAWFLDVLASPMVVAIVARECVEKFGDLRPAEATIGTGPWMFDSYRPNQGMTLVRNPGYFVSGLPYIDRVEIFVDEDNASRIAAFLAGKYDLGWENPGQINRTDWVQIKDTLNQRRPNLKTAEFPANVVTSIAMRTDKAPFSDLRVRQAISMAVDRQAIIDATLEGVGVMNPAVPAGLKDWSIPMSQLGDGARYFQHNPAAARKLLAEAGYPRGFSAPMDFTTYGSTLLVDSLQLVMKYLKDVGIEVKLNTLEYGAYIARVLSHKHEALVFGPYTPFLEPDGFLYPRFYPGEARNTSIVNDPIVTDMLVRQRRTVAATKRREIIFDIQRHLAKQQYYVQLASSVYVAVWDGALKNYGANLGFDWGGRLAAAWLDR
jgi:peptide/nickel transport system substrate-binding protein